MPFDQGQCPRTVASLASLQGWRPCANPRQGFEGTQLFKQLLLEELAFEDQCNIIGRGTDIVLGLATPRSDVAKQDVYGVVGLVEPDFGVLVFPASSS